MDRSRPQQWGKTNLSHSSINPAFVGRTDIKESKIAINAWPPQASYAILCR